MYVCYLKSKVTCKNSHHGRLLPDLEPLKDLPLGLPPSLCRRRRRRPATPLPAAAAAAATANALPPPPSRCRRRCRAARRCPAASALPPLLCHRRCRRPAALPHCHPAVLPPPPFCCCRRCRAAAAAARSAIAVLLLLPCRPVEVTSSSPKSTRPKSGGKKKISWRDHPKSLRHATSSPRRQVRELHRPIVVSE